MRMRRVSLRMTQTELAKRLGVTFQQIQKYENGSNRISVGRLTLLTNVLKVSANYFYANVGGGDFSHLLSTRRAQSLVGSFDKIQSVALRASLLSLAEALADP